ncbi:hypothetical protein SEVIR_5G347233v4 [Setaria viridis]
MHTVCAQGVLARLSPLAPSRVSRRHWRRRPPGFVSCPVAGRPVTGHQRGVGAPVALTLGQCPRRRPRPTRRRRGRMALCRPARAVRQQGRPRGGRDGRVKSIARWVNGSASDLQRRFVRVRRTAGVRSPAPAGKAATCRRTRAPGVVFTLLGARLCQRIHPLAYDADVALRSCRADFGPSTDRFRSHCILMMMPGAKLGGPSE